MDDDAFPGAVTERRAVRAVLLTPDQKVLLIRIQPPVDAAFWVMPGGGIGPGEDPVDALRRELREELGLVRCQPGPVVWLRHHTFDWDGRRLSQREEYRIVPVGRFDARMLDPREARFVTALRWWPLGDLAHAPERLTPLAAADIVRDYLANGAPDPLPPEEVLAD
ncbi:NUDIX domain-containing protein [Novosphingobium sp. YAF33]|uniref:NUDIX domain-containing protein n=1 Tax=Novosphingobium sp. YAF33 TaxID=3233082 RepID=UPI003F9E7A4F